MQHEESGVISDDSVIIDEDQVPAVYVSRYRLAERVCSPYGLIVYLVVDEEKSSSFERYSIITRTEDHMFSVPWNISNPRRFHDGLVALHTLCEQYNPLGKTLGELLVSGEVSQPLTFSHDGSNGEY
jgi:hypothetical protein